jgi:SprT protein
MAKNEAAIQREKAMLSEHLPQHTIDYVHYLFTTYPCDFKIVPPRKGKLGDCRYPINGGNAQITVNGDLPKLQFLITTIHEFAHLKTFMEMGRRVTPHGKEWKQNYITLFEPLLSESHLEKDEIEVLRQHLSSPSASSCNDSVLSDYFNSGAHADGHSDLLKNLANGSLFEFNGRRYIKGNQVQKKYIIYAAESHRDFRLSGLANVKPIANNLQNDGQLSLFQDSHSAPVIFTISQLPVGATFMYQKIRFEIIEKKRSWYICRNTKTNRFFTIHKDVAYQK